MKLSLRDTPYGKGVFAEKHLPANTAVLQFSGEIIPFAEFHRSSFTDDEDHVIQVGLSSFMAPSGGLDDYVNHSCDPNCWLAIESETNVRLVTLREISPEEELTFDYSLTSFRDPYPWAMPCSCGTTKCRGTVSNFELQPLEWQQEQLTRGFVPEYICREIVILSARR